MLKNNKNILTILDICSSKVVCIIAKCEGENGKKFFKKISKC